MKYGKTSKTSKTVSKLLSSFYSIEGSYEIQPLERENIFLLNYDKKRLIFKFHNHTARPNIKELCDIYSVCSSNGFTPKVLSTKDGGLIGYTSEYIFSLQEFLIEEEFRQDCLEVFSKRLAGLHNLLGSLKHIKIKNHFERVVVDMSDTACTYGFKYLIPVLKEIEEIVEYTPMQLIHGDLHLKNIILQSDQLYFIDFDSANFFVPVSDVAFAAFRFTDANPTKMNWFVDLYNRYNSEFQIDQNHIWPFVVYNILQRILFIIVEYERGHKQWMVDMENQKQYLNVALKFIKGRKLLTPKRGDF